MNLNATSEVGCNPETINMCSENNNNIENIINNDNNENVNSNNNNSGNSNNSYSDSVKWRELYEAQNRNFVELLQIVQNSRVNNNEKKNIYLPIFNPDLQNADANSWCCTVDLIMTECPLEGSELIMALSKCLKGCASQWLPQICFSGIKWQNFKEIFLQRFGGVETVAATVMNVLNSRPNTNECLSVYGSRLLTKLMSKWQNLTVEEIAVSVVLAQASRFDNRLKRLLFTTNITSRNTLQQELKAFTFESEVERAESTNNDPKRQKLSPIVKCHYCGIQGHKIADCRARRTSEKNLASCNPVNGGSSANKFKKPITCFKCGTVGHIASMCSKNGVITHNKQMQPEKRVDICSNVEPIGKLLQSGEWYQFFFDSGSECSIVKESVSMKFSGKRINNIVPLKGLGNATIISSLQILSIVQINNFNLEILFHVVVNGCLKYDIMIGREILSQGFVVVTNPNSFEFFKTKVVFSCIKFDNNLNIDSVNTDLANGNDKYQLISVLRKYSDYFINGIPKTRVTTGQIKIRLCDPNKTVQRRPYRLSFDERAIVRDRIQELVEANIVRPSCSPFASPILLVKKKDGSDRLCVDYRELNSNTVADKFPLPLINDQIARLGGSKYFTSLDMASGFHQIPVHANSVELTAFITPDGQYEYLTMPFGLKNAPSVFQRAVMQALGDLAYSYVVAYMDDIMIIASSPEEALQRLDTVLGVLTAAGFSFNIKKCAFLKTKVEYLGYEVEAGQIRPNPRKIIALSGIPPPETVPQLRQFIGLASYFRMFVYNFSQMLKPLYHLISAKTFVWKPEHEQIRQKVVHILTNKPVLTIFDPKYPIELHTDASSVGYGAILLHRINGRPHVIEYYSKRTTCAESRYHSYELETLAVVNAIKHFRHYLQGRQFVVYTDCNSLKATHTKLDLTPRVHRWWAFLQAFEFDIKYKDGKHMAHVDFFSRNHLSVNNKFQTRIEEKRVHLTEISNDWFRAEQQKDQEISAIVEKLENNQLDQNLAKTYELRKGMLHRKVQRNGRTLCLLVVPRTYRWSIINNIHESVMHVGWEKTLGKMYDYYWFENMSKYVRKFVDNCMTCKLSKPSSGKVPVELHPIPKVSIPWHTLHIDITGKLSGKNDLKEYIIVLIDAFTKYVLLVHTTNIDGNNCVKALQSSISLFGVPTRVIADQGRSFAGKYFREFCSKQQINLHLIATGASRANGQVERVMSTLKSLLTAVETSKRSWQDALGEVQLALNCTVNRVTKASPLELLIGKVARPLGLVSVNEEEILVDLPSIREEAAVNMLNNSLYDKDRFDKNKAKIVRYKIGDYVLLKNEERHQSKLDPKYKGPFVVAEILDGDRYTLKSLSTKRVYKYSHEFLRKLPEGQIPDELNISCEVGTVSTEHEQDLENGVEKDVNEIENGVEKDVNEIVKGVEKDVKEINTNESVDEDMENL